jgi:hypothetical protein
MYQGGFLRPALLHPTVKCVRNHGKKRSISLFLLFPSAFSLRGRLVALEKASEGKSMDMPPPTQMVRAFPTNQEGTPDDVLFLSCQHCEDYTKISQNIPSFFFPVRSCFTLSVFLYLLGYQRTKKRRVPSSSDGGESAS